VDTPRHRRAICDLVEDIEDRNVVLGDLATLPLD